eukprot:m.125279 g.125279  ORF g.125279 m.125279 type:complete len:108 (+) comp17320_c0_seq2:126-449(+)
MADPRLRKIKIQTGVLKRAGKDCEMNIKEKSSQEAYIEKCRTIGKDEYDIKKQVEVLDEVLMMIPRDIAALKTARENLEKLLDDDLKETEEYQNAKTMLNDVQVPDV